MSTKTRKPRLTRAMANKLLSLSAYAKAEAEAVADSPCPDQRAHSRKIVAAADWLMDFAHWKLNQDRTP